LDPLIGPTELYDSSGQIRLFSVEDPLGDSREWLTLDELPPAAAQATLIWEDPDFLTAPRPGIASSAAQFWNSVMTGYAPVDGSITGRLVRNALLPSGQSNPTREVALIAEINRRYT